MAIKNTGKTAGKGVLNLNQESLENLGYLAETNKDGEITEYDFGKILARYANQGDVVSFSFTIDEEVAPENMFSDGGAE